MAFLVYRKIHEDGRTFYTNENKHFSLAGYNLIYELWNIKGNPVNMGWSVSANELLNCLDVNRNDLNSALVIDFHPSAKYRIGLIEILNIHLFTYGSKEHVEWTPMMLELMDVFYKQDFTDLKEDVKEKIIEKIDVNQSKRDISIEFLYLNGSNNGWNWGSSGRTNAAFLQGEAREYFKKYF